MEESIEREDDEFTSINSYISPMKSLIDSQLRVIKKNNWVTVAADRDIKENFFKTEIDIVESSLVHADFITKIADSNNSFESDIYQEWMNKLLSFFVTYDKRVKSYLKKFPLDQIDVDNNFRAEMNFQQSITSNLSKLKSKYDKLKRKLNSASNNEIELRWKSNLPASILMYDVLTVKHPHIKEIIKEKLNIKKTKIKKNEKK